MFIVKTKAGDEVKRGDKLVDFRGDEVTFENCFHARKIIVNDKNGTSREYFCTVYDLTIEEK